MSTLPLTDLPLLPAAAAALALGLLLGLAHFHLLARNVGAYLAGDRLGRALALHLLRLCVTGLGFFLLARAGAAPLLGGLGGFLAARAWRVRPAGEVR